MFGDKPLVKHIIYVFWAPFSYCLWEYSCIHLLSEMFRFRFESNYTREKEEGAINTNTDLRNLSKGK